MLTRKILVAVAALSLSVTPAISQSSGDLELKAAIDQQQQQQTESYQPPMPANLNVDKKRYTKILKLEDSERSTMLGIFPGKEVWFQYDCLNGAGMHTTLLTTQKLYWVTGDGKKLYYPDRRTLQASHPYRKFFYQCVGAATTAGVWVGAARR